MNIYDLTNKAFLLGNAQALKNDNIFYFGKRQTGSTFNMLLKGIIKGFNSGEIEYRIGYVMPNLNMAPRGLVESIASKLDLEIIKNSKTGIVLGFKSLKVTIDFFTTEVSSRGRNDDLFIVDEPEFLKEKKSFFRSLFVSGKDYMIGGESIFG